MLSKCEHCGKEFETSKPKRYCSKLCIQRAWRIAHRPPRQPFIRKCLNCGKEFETKNAKRKCCSHSCSARLCYKRNGGERRKCAICGKEFMASTGKKYCSEECLSIAQHQARAPRALKYNLVCRICGKEFMASVPFKLYCSAKCANVAWTRKARAAYQRRFQAHIRKCPVCGQEFVAKQSRSRFCSDRCRQLFHNNEQKLKSAQTWAKKEVNRIEVAERRRLTIEERLTQAQQEKRLEILADNKKVRAQIRAFVESRRGQ